MLDEDVARYQIRRITESDHPRHTDSEIFATS